MFGCCDITYVLCMLPLSARLLVLSMLCTLCKTACAMHAVQDCLCYVRCARPLVLCVLSTLCKTACATHAVCAVQDCLCCVICAL